MNAVSWRDLCAALSAFAVTGSTTAFQERTSLEFETAKATLSTSEVFSPELMSATTSANGAKRWDIVHGVLATGEAIAVHESLQPAGIRPNPHAIQHSELILVQEGTLLFEHDDRSEKVGAGGIIFVAFGTMHAARNVGDGPARYLVIAVGGDTK
jgi:quercetin dioxygenase-like cupin family protein